MDSINNKIERLLAKLSLKEKVGQLVQLNLGELPQAGDSNFEDTLREKLTCQSIGVICITPRDSPEESRQKIERVQNFLRNETSHGIPALAAAETLHGLLSPGATIFPQAIAMGSTWNIRLIKAIGKAIACEAASIGINQALAPVLDLGRDPRFGRIEECFGECPTLVKNLGLAYIQGMQGQDPTQVLDAEKVLCTAKHLGGYSTPANGINNSPVHCGERDLRSLHLVPFLTAVKKGKLQSVMPCYNEVDSTPSHANQWLLNSVLRGEWGFDGYVYSDWGGVSMNHNVHHVAKSYEDAARIALESGVDFDAPEGHSFLRLEKLVQQEAITEDLIDQAVRRILRCKIMAGLFEEKPPPPPRLSMQSPTRSWPVRQPKNPLPFSRTGITYSP